MSAVEIKSLRVMATHIRESNPEPDIEAQALGDYVASACMYAVADAYDHLAYLEEMREDARLQRLRAQWLEQMDKWGLGGAMVLSKDDFRLHHYGASHGYMGQTYSDDEFIQRTTHMHPEDIGKPKGWRMFKSYGGDIGVIQ